MAAAIIGLRSGGMDIGMSPLLARFILSPKISPNTCSMSWIILMLDTLG
jgi:hypothetical protein